MKNNPAGRRRFENGFSYIEVMISLVIMLVGILSLTSALAANMMRSYESEKRIAAKQYALSTIESMISARDVARADGISGWNSIGSVGTNPVNGVNQGIFLTGFNPIREDMGWDGVAGTADDACAGTGACTVGGNSNTSPVVESFQRQVVITDIDDPERPSPRNPIARRRVEVTVRYYVNQIVRDEVVSTIVAKY